jgi:cell division protein FtsN
MSRDYKSRNTTKTRKNGGSLLLGLFIGYTLGLASAIGVWLYISQAPSPYLTEGKTAEKVVKDQSSEKSAQQSREKKAALDADQSDTNKPRFDFYKILPGIEEPISEDVLDLPPPTVAPVKKIPEKAPESGNQYYLQTGSFRNPGDAERMKAELALLGVIASVQTGKSENNVLLHRVRVGPFTRMEELDQVRASLQASGIVTSLVRASSNAP